MNKLTRKAHSSVRCSLLALLAPLAGGACTDLVGVVVRAEAKLAPIGGSGVRGSVVIGHGQGFPDDVTANQRWIELPDDGLRRLAVYDATDCNVDQATARVFDPPPASATKPDGDLGTIRRHDGEVVFYEDHYIDSLGKDYGELYVYNAPIGDMTFEVGAPGSVLGKIAVVRGPSSADGRPGAWQACATFISTNYLR